MSVPKMANNGFESREQVSMTFDVWILRKQLELLLE
jgi:hypothetical protein